MEAGLIAEKMSDLWIHSYLDGKEIDTSLTLAVKPVASDRTQMQE